jgi:hypothetical protein
MANALKEFLTVDFSDLRPIGQSGLFTLPGRPPVGSPIDFSSYASRRQHGILIPELCPDAPPRLVRLWQDISARTWRMPENIRLAPNKRKRRSQANFRSSRQISESEDTSTDWCGSQAVLPSGQSFYYSVIQFNVPQLAVPNPNAGGGFLKESPQGGYTLSVWVGLDGGIANLLPSGANVPGGDIWQAGVDCTINAEGNVSYDTWYQWFSPTMPGDSPATPLNINAGDTIIITVAYTYSSNGSINGGTYQFANATTNEMDPATFIALPPCTAPNGSAAAWIVETPQEQSNPDQLTGATSTNNTTLPRFQDIVITGLGVGTESKASEAGSSQLIQMSYPPPDINNQATATSVPNPGNQPNLRVRYVS